MRNLVYSFFVFLILSTLPCLFYAKKESVSNIIFEKETNYYLARVVDSVIPDMGEARMLFLDFDSHSIEFKNKEEKPMMYTSIYPIFGLIKQDGIKRINVIGGGAYTLPKNLADEYEDSKVVVVEVDKEVINIAEKYFDIGDRNIKAVNSDARIYFNKNNIKYDLVFGDAYNSFISIPWHLTTYEFLKDIKNNLNKGGIYAVNFISSVKGDGSLFFNSTTKTFSEVFPNYYIFAFGNNLYSTQNVILVGINNDIPSETEQSLRKRLLDSSDKAQFAQFIVSKNEIDLSKAIIFMDDFAPVEKMMIPVMKNYFPQYLSFYNSVFE